MQGITDVILLSLLRTDFSKQKFNKVILFGITITIRYMICSLFSFLFYLYINFYVNLFLDIMISIIFVMNTDKIYKIVGKYEEETLFMSNYFIDNYNYENFRIWKKYLIIVISFYYIIYYAIFPITSQIMIIYIIQSLICYLIVDNLENKNGLLYDIYNKVMDYKYVKTKLLESPTIIDNYNEKEILNEKDFIYIKNNSPIKLLQSNSKDNLNSFIKNDDYFLQ